ncbi:MAG: class I SAM-dependent methyltransferase [Bryobacteraceae bacterium]
MEFGMSETMRDCYDQLAANYHLIFADWNTSIMRQAGIIGPIIENENSGSRRRLRILDCACGIGTQALGLAIRGHLVVGCDISRLAIERARREASERRINAEFVVADMRDLSPVWGDGFDAVVCFDNSLPHLESYKQVCQVASEIRKKLRAGGLFMASIRDYDQLIREKPVVQGPNFYSDQGKRRIVHQVWDWIDDRRYTFHLYITRETSTGWESQHYAATYRALLRSELTSAIENAGFIDQRWLLPAETGFYQPIVIARAGSPSYAVTK